ncbi:FAD-binding monooxygenase [Nonomuraea deserti]|uniref:FAD-binding monooxygenase n=1 Tax=Nonomuraea deserti TaxID=1848322 RepID=A0A4V2YCT0_9ACTN|nr:FAD-binding monooxygenase [Nonomuraea deserti]
MGAPVKVACVGGGPANLYFSILMKRVDPSHDITIYERNPAGSTYGWGVTYWDELFNDLHRADADSARAISESSVRWDSWVADIRDRATVTVEQGEAGYGISRRRLLGILAERAESLGVRIEWEREITDQDGFGDADLVVAGDGVNSVLRDRHAEHFGPEFHTGQNIYIWLGTTKVFDAFVFAFVETEHGWIWCYGYKYSQEHSTCVIECTPETWRGLGLDQGKEADSLAILEKLFADILDGHPLIGRAQADGTAHWLHFRTLTNRTWHHGNVVLVGDAAHTTHYSIGAGTALALADASVLAKALYQEKDLETALTAYERESKSKLRSPQRAARYSARWFESLPRYIDRSPMQVITLLGQRHSVLQPLVPPALYYQFDRIAGRVGGLFGFGR